MNVSVASRDSAIEIVNSLSQQILRSGGFRLQPDKDSRGADTIGDTQ